MLQVLFVLSSVPSLFFPQDAIVEMSAVRDTQCSYIMTLAQGATENVLRLHCFEGEWLPGDRRVGVVG